MAQRTIEVGKVDREKTIYHFDFEPDIGKQHLPSLTYEGNNQDKVFRQVARDLPMSRTLRDSYILSNVGRFS